MQKNCSKCLLAKDISLFHKDSTSKDGYSSACGVCRNKRKASRIVHKVKIEEIPADNVKTLPVVTEGQENIFKKLSEKYGSFYTISVEHSGKCQLQVFKGAPKIIRGESHDVESLLRKMVAA